MLSRTPARAATNLLLVFVVALFAVLVGRAQADVSIYSQPPNAAGGQYKSAWYAPDGLDNDEYVWDSFTLSSSTAITQIQWRGAYTNYVSGAGTSPVYNFTFAIYSSIPGGSQPDVVNGRLVRYQVGNNAGETPVGIAGGYNMYDYHFVLPAPFQAAANTKYWVQIYAWQGLTPNYYWPPDWSFARGTGGNGSHFRRVGGTGGSFASITGDCAFTLMASSLPTFNIVADVAPAGAGSITGAGAYPSGTNASLTAAANHGYGFVNWTENGSQVSTNSQYNFTVTRDRTLVANFVPAYSVITAASPTYGGSTTGDGIFNEGSTITVTATPNQGFVFSEWSYFGTQMSTAATYSFPAAQDITLTAVFVPAPNSTTFDFDDAPVHTSLPISLISDVLGASFSATGSGFSIQPVGSVGLAPAGMSGLYIFPNSVFPADLIADFSLPLIDFSIMYSPQELGCDDSATMRVTAFMNGVQVGTNTATVPVPGTYPTGTLRITVPSGFNRAVVHYDSRPPRCQDYGVIFLADNLTVTMKCEPATVTQDPVDTTVCPNDIVAGGGPALNAFSYQWQFSTGGGWTPLVDDVVPGVGTVWGSGSGFLQVMNPLASGVQFRCVVTDPCGVATSNPATLTVNNCTPCPADFNQDGGVDGADVDAFFTAWEAGDPSADVNQDGGIDGGDVATFFTAWEAGGC